MEKQTYRPEGASERPNPPAVGSGVVPMAGLTPGRIVHYVSQEGETRKTGEHCAALIIEVYDSGVALQVFLPDGGLVSRRNVPHSEGKEPRTWHWIERA